MAAPSITVPSGREKGLLERILSPVAAGEPGEAPRVLLLSASLFLLLASYYMVKTVREALILTEDGAVSILGKVQRLPFSRELKGERTMRKSNKTWDCVVGLLVGAALLADGALAEGMALAQARGKTETLIGVVSDTMCGAKHHPGMEDHAKQCTIGCVKSMKAKYALVMGDKVYTLEGRVAELEKLAGGKAKVTGTLQRTTIKVTSVSSVI